MYYISDPPNYVPSNIGTYLHQITHVHQSTTHNTIIGEMIIQVSNAIEHMQPVNNVEVELSRCYSLYCRITAVILSAIQVRHFSSSSYEIRYSKIINLKSQTEI